MAALFEIGLNNLVVATILALAIATVGRFLRSPALIHGLWLLVLVKLLTPPVIAVQVPLPRAWHEFGLMTDARAAGKATASLADGAMASAEAPANGPAALWDRVRIGLIGLWGVGTGAYFAAAAIRMLRFRRLLQMTAHAPDALQEEVDGLAARMGMPRGPRLLLVPGPVSPMLWSIGGWARLLFPNDLLKRLAPEARETLLLHELAHLWRRDHWVRIIEFLATGLYWWNPVVWWARREIHIAEEDCCDAWVLWEWPTGRKTYATALLETIEFLSETRPALPLAASGIGRVEFMQRRLKRIMRGTESRGLSTSGRWAMAALALVLLPTFPQAASARNETQPAATVVASDASNPGEVRKP